MSGLVDYIIDIAITRQTTAIEVASFDNSIIVQEFESASITPSFTERVRKYSSMQEIIDAGFPTNSAVYLAAQALFTQDPNNGTIYVGRKEVVADGGPESWTEALSAINEASKKWYILHIGSRTLADMQEVADWAEANKKLYIASSNDSNIISGTGDIAEYVEENNYDRTAIIYHSKADLTVNDPFIESAWAGLMLTYDPGSANWSYKTIKGVTADEISSSQNTLLEEKNANSMQSIAGKDTIIFGKVGSGEWLDIIRGTDWLEANIQSNILSLLFNTPKVSYDDQGIQSIGSNIRSSLQEGVDVDLIVDDYTISLPESADVSAVDKSNRILDNVTFAATYKGAVNRAKIRGTISS